LEIDWLKDFLAVIECGGFTRAAEARNVTQPALSRRIRALEEWVGAPLIHRTTQSMMLTPAGEAFRPAAEDILRRLEAGRTEAQEQAHGVSDQLKFAATNALSLTFFPAWLRQIEPSLPFVVNIQLVANHMEACEKLMLQGQAQFLLCHHHPQAETALGAKQFVSLAVGQDVLIPVSAPAAAGKPEPLFALPGTEATLLPYLSYKEESGMGRIVAAVRASATMRPYLKPTFTSHLAKLMVTMALDGRGMAWLPESLISEDLATDRLVRAGDKEWDIPIEIHLFRPRTRLTPIAEKFWKQVSGLNDGYQALIVAPGKPGG
jgi:DNA-binding transcriptional LysR family regulator